MLEEAFSYAVRGDWKRRAIRGGAIAAPVVILLPVTLLWNPPLAIVALLAGVPLVGYALRVLAEPIADEEPPAIAEPLGLVRTGIVGAGVLIGYAILPAVAVAAGVWGLAGSDVGLWTVAVPAGAAFAIGAYLAPAAMFAVARSGSLTGAADWGVIVRAASGLPYVSATLQSLVVWFTAGGVAVMLLVTVFGLLAVPTVVFFSLLVVARLYAHAIVATIDPSAVAAANEESMPGM